MAAARADPEATRLDAVGMAEDGARGPAAAAASRGGHAWRRAKAFARVNASVAAVAAAAHWMAAAAMETAAGGVRDLEARDVLWLYASTVVKTAVFVIVITASAAHKPKIMGGKRTKEPSRRDDVRLAGLALVACVFETVELVVVAGLLDVSERDASETAQVALGEAPALALRLPRWWMAFVLKSFAFEVIFDFFHYWGHRLSHEIPRLYRYHRIHHKFLHPNPLATYQQDPYDIVFTNLLPNLAAVILVRELLGVRFGAFEYTLLMCYKVFVEIAGHAGIETTATSFPQCSPLPQALGIELRTNDHDLHHSFPGMACNFAKRFTLWDRAFGTYKVKSV